MSDGTDCISRQSAIDALRKLREEDIEDYGCEIPEGFNQDHLDRATFAINQLPSAQPERIKGRWVPADTLCGIKCSNCGYPVDDFCYSIDYIDLEYAPNFCPNCGADMRGEQDG